MEKVKLKTLITNAKVRTLKKKKNKEIKVKVQRNLSGQLLVLSLEHEIDIQKVLCYPLSPVPWSLSTSNGLPLKTNKATLLHKLQSPGCLLSEDITRLPGTVHVIDGNSLSMLW